MLPHYANPSYGEIHLLPPLTEGEGWGGVTHSADTATTSIAANR